MVYGKFESALLSFTLPDERKVYMKDQICEINLFEGIPLQMLKALTDILTEQLVFIKSTEANEPMLDTIFDLLSQYQRRVSFLKQNEFTCKLSTMKDLNEMSFLPTNLHFQCLSCSEERENAGEEHLEIFTMGSLTAHGMAKKKSLNKIMAHFPLSLDLVDFELTDQRLCYISQSHARGQMAEMLIDLIASPTFHSLLRLLYQQCDQTTLSAVLHGRPLEGLEMSETMFIDHFTQLIEMCRTDDPRILTETIALVQRTTLQVRKMMCRDPKRYVHFHCRLFSLASQSISVVAVVLQRHLMSKYTNPLLRLQLLEGCVLLGFESLLTAYDNEQSYLDDSFLALQLSSHAQYCFVRESDSPVFPPRVEFVGYWRVRIPLPEDCFDALEGLTGKDSSGLISLTPIWVLFTCGINQERVKAKLSGGDYLQRHINTFSLAKLSSLWSRLSPALDSLGNSQLEASINELVGSLSTSIDTGSPLLLGLSSKIIQALCGARVTFCKSGKDRTAMSVTLEEADYARELWRLDEDTFLKILDSLRINGTRLSICHKNTGLRKYSFSALQIKFFPKPYRPPKGTFAPGTT